MHTEYVRLSKDEKNEGYKNLLYSQLEYLNSIRSFNNYRALRNKELSLKISFKSKISNILSEMEKFESLLPKPHFLEEINIKKKKMENKMAKKAEVNPLASEIDIIKQKLSRLQSGI